jgi:ABC-type xylose transport system permease subunit
VSDGSTALDQLALIEKYPARMMAGAAVAYAVIFALAEPAMLWFQGAFEEIPVPFHTSREWTTFELICAMVGAIVGAGWLLARRRVPGFWRDWVGAYLFVALISIDLAVGHLAQSDFTPRRISLLAATFVFSTAVSATLLAALFALARRSIRAAAKP